ncbi:hypothetical protein KEM55_007014 [Ascosphaera atra]|nr:hypothetical protein KEM55_007014 [Ascosphaera atra]
MSGDYKSRKEAFVSNLTGGDISEINQVTLVAPVRHSSPPNVLTFTKLTVNPGRCTPLVSTTIAPVPVRGE